MFKAPYARIENLYASYWGEGLETSPKDFHFFMMQKRPKRIWDCVNK